MPYHKTKRKIISIDTTKCDGCGLCAKSCAEGAIQVVDGKAKLVSETYCDGLGACLAKCPKDAIAIVEKEAEAFDERAVHKHLHAIGATHAHHHPHEQEHHNHPQAHGQEHDHAAQGDHSHPQRHGGSGCPGSLAFLIERPAEAPRVAPPEADSQSELTQWPVQLALISPNAPYWHDADLLIAADCVPFAFSAFHQRLLKRRKLIIACPKLDDTGPYLDKLTALFTANHIRSVTVAHMEVPCCTGLVHLAKEAIKQSGRDIAFKTVKIGIKGDIQRD